MSKDTGGPAFPAGAIRKTRQRPNDPGSDFVVSDMTEPRNAGMTLRDYFAANAMQGIVSSIDSEDNYQRLRGHASKGGLSVSEWIACDAYKQADAMLAERAK